MNINTYNLLQAIIMYAFVIGAVSFIYYSFIRLRVALREYYIKITVINAVNYAKSFSVEDYEAYEKYGIWRYFVHC